MKNLQSNNKKVILFFATAWCNASWDLVQSGILDGIYSNYGAKASLLCANARGLSKSDSISKAVEIIENDFIKKFGIDKEDKDYKKKVAAVYNKYADKLICNDTPSFRSRNPEQFIKRVISLECIYPFWMIFYYTTMKNIQSMLIP
tara:strand:- start:431 stop:868 length:438 start_codon:yes stop_codon:yes gene_type:complete